MTDSRFNDQPREAQLRKIAQEIIDDLTASRRQYRRKPNAGHHLMVCMKDDAYDAVRRVMREHNLSKSGAVHHLVRLGAGLDPLLP